MNRSDYRAAASAYRLALRNWRELVREWQDYNRPAQPRRPHGYDVALTEGHMLSQFGWHGIHKNWPAIPARLRKNLARYGCEPRAVNFGGMTMLDGTEMRRKVGRLCTKAAAMATRERDARIQAWRSAA